MIEPIDDWESDLWPVFDRLKSAMDKQEQARLDGTLAEFVKKASPLFIFMSVITSLVRDYDQTKTDWVYLTWKSSRGINQWYPDRDLPLRWRLAEDAPMPLPTAEWVEKTKAKYQGWKDKDKANAKAMKAEYRRLEKEQKKKDEEFAKRYKKEINLHELVVAKKGKKK